MSFRKRIFSLCIAMNILFYIGFTAIAIKYHVTQKRETLFKNIKARSGLIHHHLKMIVADQRRLVLNAEAKGLEKFAKSALYSSLKLSYVGELKPDNTLKDLYTSEDLGHRPPVLYPNKKDESYFFISNKLPMTSHLFIADKEDNDTLKNQKKYIVSTKIDVADLKNLAAKSLCHLTFMGLQNDEFAILYSTLDPLQTENLKEAFVRELPDDTLNVRNSKYNIVTYKTYSGETIQQAIVYTLESVDIFLIDYFIVLAGGLLLFCISTLVICLGYWWAETRLNS